MRASLDSRSRLVVALVLRDRLRLAGLTVPDEDVLELAVLLRRGGFADTADTLQADVAANRPDIAHTILAREAMIGALDDPPTKALSELRGVLLEGARGPRPRRACVARGKVQTPSRPTGSAVSSLVAHADYMGLLLKRLRHKYSPAARRGAEAARKHTAQVEYTTWVEAQRASMRHGDETVAAKE